MEPTKAQRVVAFLKWIYVYGRGVCERRGEEEGAAKAEDEEEKEEEEGAAVEVRIDADGGAEAEVEAVMTAAIGKSIDTYVLAMKKTKDDLKGLLDGVKAAHARIEALRTEHNKVIALRLIDGEEVDGDGMIMMSRKPLTVVASVKERLRCCTCRAKLLALFNTETGEVLDARRERAVDVAAAAIVPAAGGGDGGGTEDSGADDGGAAGSVGGARVSGAAPAMEFTATLNPFGIAMRAMRRPAAVSEGDNVERSFAFVPPEGFGGATTAVADANGESVGSAAAPALL